MPLGVFRMNFKMNLLFILVFVGLVSSTNAQDKILGKWKTEGGDSVELYKCENVVCGKLIGFKKPTYTADMDSVKRGQVKVGDPLVDTENPDPSKRTTPLLGFTFLKNFKYQAEDDEYTNGEIYDPGSGNTYVGELKMEGNDVLKLNGHLKISRWLGKKQTWTRIK
jgi:uncharacterized protein (DUF2147 family)